MRVTFPTRTRPVITLGRSERALWGATTADGRLVRDTRCTVLAKVRSLIASGAICVEVYAPAEAGSFMIEQHMAGGAK